MPWGNFEVKNHIEITAFHSLFENQFPSDWNFDGESHDFWECVYVIDGNIFASGDGRVYSLTQGEMIFHEPMEFHRLWLDGKNGANVLIFSFSAKGELLDFFRDKVLRFSKDERNIILKMLEFMRNAHKGKKLDDSPMEFRYLAPLGNNAEYLETVVSYVNLLLLSLLGNTDTARAEDTQEAKVFHSCVEFMNRNISGKISVEELARYSKTSTSTLKRIFAKYTGISVHRYFLNMKINTATELLQNGKSVTEAAEMSGFSSHAHLSKIYKKMTGKNPSSIRR